MLVVLCASRGVYCIIEQPHSSKFRFLPEYIYVKTMFDQFVCPFMETFLSEPQSIVLSISLLVHAVE